MQLSNNMPVWPGWETVRLIGRGSYGAVYEIERDLYGHTEKAAMKVISIPQNSGEVEELYDSGYDEQSVTGVFRSHLQSILQEYSLMRELNGSANVVNCDDVQVIQHDDGIGWDILIRMELLQQMTKARTDQLVEEQAIQLGKDMCRALALCRKHGIIHRDIKPQNIFISSNGDYKLGDFGIAKTIERTSGGTKIGTYKYMAPEVYNNRPYNHTADIYSLGWVLHWVLNERRAPFVPLPPAPASVAAEEEGRARRLRGEPIPAPANGSRELQRIVLKACAFEPKDRYQSADEMLRDLEAAERRGEKPETADHYEEELEAEERTTRLPRKRVAPVGEEMTTRLRETPETDKTTETGEIRAAPERVTEQKVYTVVPDTGSPVEDQRKKLLRIGIPLAAALIAVLAMVLALRGRKTLPANDTSLSASAPKSAAVTTAAPKKSGGSAPTVAPTPKPTKAPTPTPKKSVTAAPHVHEWGSWTTVTKATCTTAGKEKRVCKLDSSHTETREIPALGHDLSEATYTKPATCSRCGETVGEVKGYIGSLRGSWKSVKLTKRSHNSAFILDEPIKSCRRVTMHFVVDSSTGSPAGNWLLYGQKKDGSWRSIGTFKVSKDAVSSHKEIKVKFEFDKGTAVYGLAIGRRGTNGYTISYKLWFTDCQSY